MDYDWIYKLPVGKEQKNDPGWYRLKWRPVKRGTCNIYFTDCHHSWRTKMIGVRWGEASAHNGWHRYWDGFYSEFGFYFFILNFWIRWNIIVHKDGPSDVKEKDRKPLNIRGKR